MGGIFDKLQKKMEGEGGSLIQQLPGLPPNQRRIMRILMNEEEAMPYSELWGVVQALPEGQLMTEEEMRTCLRELAKDGWVIFRGEGSETSYEPHLGRKPTTKLPQSTWSMLGTRIEGAKSLRQQLLDAAQEDDT